MAEKNGLSRLGDMVTLQRLQFQGKPALCKSHMVPFCLILASLAEWHGRKVITFLRVTWSEISPVVRGKWRSPVVSLQWTVVQTTGNPEMNKCYGVPRNSGGQN